MGMLSVEFIFGNFSGSQKCIVGDEEVFISRLSIHDVVKS